MFHEMSTNRFCKRSAKDASAAVPGDMEQLPVTYELF